EQVASPSEIPSWRRQPCGWGRAARSSLALLLGGSLHLLQQRRHVGPQPLAGGALFGQQLPPCRLVADVGPGGILLPVLHPLLHQRAGLGCAAAAQLRVNSQVGAKPVVGLLAEAGPFLVIEPGGVFPLASGGQRRATGGVVAVLCPEVVGQSG